MTVSGVAGLEGVVGPKGWIAESSADCWSKGERTVVFISIVVVIVVGADAMT